MKLHMRRTGDWLIPASELDYQDFSKIKPGQIVRCEIKRSSARSLAHHRMYFGGLLELALEYWEPSGGLVTPVETELLTKFAAYCERQGNAPGALQGPLAEFLAKIQRGRAEKVELPVKTREMLHRWIKEELNYYEVYDTPTGPRKALKSISFARMGQAEFEEFYKAAFGLLWRFIMVRIYDSPEAAQEAVMARLESMV